MHETENERPDPDGNHLSVIGEGGAVYRFDPPPLTDGEINSADATWHDAYGSATITNKDILGPEDGSVSITDSLAPGAMKLDASQVEGMIVDLIERGKALELENQERVDSLAAGKYGFPVNYPLDLGIIRQFCEHLLDYFGELDSARLKTAEFISERLDTLEESIKNMTGGLVRVPPGTDVNRLIKPGG